MYSSVPSSIARVLSAGLFSAGLIVFPALVGADFTENLSGMFALESRHFFEAPTTNRQHNANLSGYGEFEYYHALDDGKNNFVITPFFRLDENDSERTHGDFRELAWLHYADSFELRVGISKVFWGVAESRHLVDIINQTDSIENTDGEDKLGQPMVNISYLSDTVGTFDFFLLPYFRQRTFAGINGRPALPLPVDTDNPVYESADEEKHIDFAVRWSHSIDIWDIGLAYFDGTAREPRLVAGRVNNAAVLVPHYDQIGQISLDAQATTEDWLWKIEAIYVDTRSQANYGASVTGFEYTFVGVFDTAADVGVIGEYLYDQRDDTQAFQNDLLLGVRWVLNDEASTELLFGIIQDLEGGARSVSLEAGRRISEHVKFSAELRLINDAAEDAVLRFAENDNLLQLELGYYF